MSIFQRSKFDVIYTTWRNHFVSVFGICRFQDDYDIKCITHAFIAFENINVRSFIDVRFHVPPIILPCQRILYTVYRFISLNTSKLETIRGRTTTHLSFRLAFVHAVKLILLKHPTPYTITSCFFLPHGVFRLIVLWRSLREIKTYYTNIVVISCVKFVCIICGVFFTPYSYVFVAPRGVVGNKHYPRIRTVNNFKQCLRLLQLHHRDLIVNAFVVFLFAYGCCHHFPTNVLLFCFQKLP